MKVAPLIQNSFPIFLLSLPKKIILFLTAFFTTKLTVQPQVLPQALPQLIFSMGYLKPSFYRNVHLALNCYSIVDISMIHFVFLKISVMSNTFSISLTSNTLPLISRRKSNLKILYHSQIIRLMRDSSGFTTSLYLTTFTGLYNHFSSLTPIKYKINLINSLLYRAFHIFSSYFSLHHEITLIRTFLSKSSYPKHLLGQAIRSDA